MGPSIDLDPFAGLFDSTLPNQQPFEPASAPRHSSFGTEPTHFGLDNTYFGGFPQQQQQTHDAGQPSYTYATSTAPMYHHSAEEEPVALSYADFMTPDEIMKWGRDMTGQDGQHVQNMLAFAGYDVDVIVARYQRLCRRAAQDQDQAAGASAGAQDRSISPRERHDEYQTEEMSAPNGGMGGGCDVQYGGAPGAQVQQGTLHQVQGSMRPPPPPVHHRNPNLDPGLDSHDYASGTTPTSRRHNQDSRNNSLTTAPARGTPATHSGFSGGSGLQQPTNHPAEFPPGTPGTPAHGAGSYLPSAQTQQTGIPNQPQSVLQQSVRMARKSSSAAKKTGGKAGADESGSGKKKVVLKEKAPPTPAIADANEGGDSNSEEEEEEEGAGNTVPSNAGAGGVVTMTFTGFQNYTGLTYASPAAALADMHHGRSDITLPAGVVDDYPAYKHNPALRQTAIENFVKCFSAAYSALHKAGAQQALVTHAAKSQEQAFKDVDALLQKHGMRFLEHQAAKLVHIFIEANELGPIFVKGKSAHFRVDTTLTCSERLKAGCEAIKSDARVRREILQDKVQSMEMLAGNPASHVKAKQTYLSSNSTRKEGAPKKEKKGAAAKSSAPKSKGVKRKTADANTPAAAQKGRRNTSASDSSALSADTMALLNTVDRSDTPLAPTPARVRQPRATTKGH